VFILVLSSMAIPLREFTQVTWMNVGWRQMASNSLAKLRASHLT